MTGEDICAAAELHFYNSAGVRQDVNLPEAQGLEYIEDLAGDGGATYKAPLLAQALATHPDLLESGICKVAMVLSAGAAPTEVGAWELVPTSGTSVGEASDRDVQCTAPGLRHLLTYAPVLPHPILKFFIRRRHEAPLAIDFTADARLFGWMGYDFDSSAWGTALNLAHIDPSAATSGGYPPTLTWPDKTAKWINAYTETAVGATHLFRSSFLVEREGYFRIYYVGGDTVKVYLDSALIGQADPGYTQVQHFDTPLNAGLHVLAAEASSVTHIEPIFGCTVAHLDHLGGAPTFILSSTGDYPWQALRVPLGGDVPGVTAASILLTVLAETSFCYGMSLLHPDFTATLDSAGNPWPTIPGLAVPVMTTTVADLLQQLEELSFDARILGDGTFQAFISQGADVSSTVVFQPGQNLLRMDFQGSPVRATRVLVRSLQGWSESDDVTAAGLYGLRYIGVTSGISPSVAQGETLGESALEELARPRYTYTATVRAVPGAVPFGDFHVGDLVRAPDRLEVMTVMRVVSIKLQTPTDTPGPVLFMVELDAP